MKKLEFVHIEPMFLPGNNSGVVGGGVGVGGVGWGG